MSLYFHNVLLPGYHPAPPGCNEQLMTTILFKAGRQRRASIALPLAVSAPPATALNGQRRPRPAPLDGLLNRILPAGAATAPARAARHVGLNLGAQQQRAFDFVYPQP